MNEEPNVVKLGEEYDGCLLGATIGLGETQLIYSIRKMILREQMDKPGKPLDEIRECLAKDIQEVQRLHGIFSPVFCNDELVQPVEEKPEGPKILKPGDSQFRHYPNNRN